VLAGEIRQGFNVWDMPGAAVAAPVWLATDVAVRDRREAGRVWDVGAARLGKVGLRCWG
jgi:hypothetical protein